MEVKSDDTGLAIIEEVCFCGHFATTHDDATFPLAFCQDCYHATCPECRDEKGDRCLTCAA